jgi:hypothetical protein
VIGDSATHKTSPGRLEGVRPPGGAKFIAYDHLEEVAGAPVQWRGGLLVVFCEGVRLAEKTAIAPTGLRRRCRRQNSAIEIFLPMDERSAARLRDLSDDGLLRDTLLLDASGTHRSTPRSDRRRSLANAADPM